MGRVHRNESNLSAGPVYHLALCLESQRERVCISICCKIVMFENIKYCRKCIQEAFEWDFIIGIKNMLFYKMNITLATFSKKKTKNPVYSSRNIDCELWTSLNILELSSQFWLSFISALFEHIFYRRQCSFSYLYISIVARHLDFLWSSKPNRRLWCGNRTPFCGKTFTSFMVTLCHDSQHAAVNQLKCLFSKWNIRVTGRHVDLKKTPSTNDECSAHRKHCQ